MEIMKPGPVASDTGQRLLAALETFRGATPAADDQTLVVLERRQSAYGQPSPH